MKHKIGIVLAAGMTAVGLYALFTWPLVAHMASAFPSDHPKDHGDGKLIFCIAQTCFDNLVHHRSLGLLAGIYHPFQIVSLANFSFIGYGLLLNAIPHQPILCFNLMLFASVFLTAGGTSLLVMRFVKSNWLGAWAGCFYALSPFALCRLGGGHTILFITAFVPWFYFAFIKGISIQRGQIRIISLPWSCLMAASFFLVFAGTAYYAYYLGVSVLACAAWRFWGLDGRPIVWNRKTALLIAAVLFISTFSMVLLKFVLKVKSGFYALSMDLTGYLLPSTQSLLWSRFQWIEHLRPGVIPGELMAYPGVAVLVLTILYLVCRSARRCAGQEERLMVFCAAVVLLWGFPVIKLFGIPLIATPSVFAYFMPVVHGLRGASRANGVLLLFGALLSAIAFERVVLPRLVRPGLKRMASAALCLVTFAELMPQQFYLESSDNIPLVYRRLAGLPYGALLNIPFGVFDGEKLYLGLLSGEGLRMWYQMTCHHKPILSGYTIRLSPAEGARIAERPLLAGVGRLLADTPSTPAEIDDRVVRQELKFYGLRYIVVDPDKRQSAAWQWLRPRIAPEIDSESEVDGYLLVTLRPQ